MYGGLVGLINISNNTAIFFGNVQRRTFLKESAELRLRALRVAGLTVTAGKLAEELLNLDLAHDKALAQQINKFAGQLLSWSKEKQKQEVQIYPHWEKDLGNLQQGARKAGFNKTADAAGDALTNIRAAVAR